MNLGLYIFHFAWTQAVKSPSLPLQGGGVYELLAGWGKIWWFVKKKREYKWEELENGKKEELFTVPREKISFLEMGVVAKISYFGKIFTPVCDIYIINA